MNQPCKTYSNDQLWRILQGDDEGDVAGSSTLKKQTPETRPWRRERWKRPNAWTESMAKSLLTAASHPEMLGRIGRYDVERLIGSGGLGVVFKAYDTELHRPVAVKLLAPYLASSGSARNRLLVKLEPHSQSSMIMWCRFTMWKPTVSNPFW